MDSTQITFVLDSSENRWRQSGILEPPENQNIWGSMERAAHQFRAERELRRTTLKAMPGKIVDAKPTFAKIANADADI